VDIIDDAESCASVYTVVSESGAGHGGAGGRGRRQAGPLAPISTNRMNLSRVAEIDETGAFGAVLPMLTDPFAFEAALTKPLPEAVPLSRDMLRHAHALEAYGVIRQSGEAPRCVMTAFTTPKKLGDERFVLDGRPLNARMSRPPPMELPRLRDLVRDIKAAKWAVLADGKNWFYQFPISPDVGRFFGVRLGGPRGGRAHADAADGFLTVLCMGWSWAPYIAQTASAALVRGLGWAWLDNFIITAGTRSDASRKWGEFGGRTSTDISSTCVSEASSRGENRRFYQGK
jgi:hypothetical protein